MSAVEAAIARARQAFGLDAYSDAEDPAGSGMALVRRLFLDEWQDGAIAVAVRVRPAEGREQRGGRQWAVDTLRDDDVIVRIRYRIGNIGIGLEPVERDLPISEVWRLARNPHARLVDVRASDPGTWFRAVVDVESDGVRYYVEVEDRSGIGNAIVDRDAALLAVLRGAIKRQPGAHKRAQIARSAIAAPVDHQAFAHTAFDSVEQLAAIEYLANPSKDDGPPAVSWVIVAAAPGRVSRILEGGGRVNRQARRMNKLASKLVGALSIEAHGSTHIGHRQAAQWQTGLPVDENDETLDVAEGANGFGRGLGNDAPGDPHARAKSRGRQVWQQDRPAEALVDAETARDDAESVHRGLSKLTPRQRRVVELRADEFTHEEIAQILGITASTSRSTLATAVKKFRSA